MEFKQLQSFVSVVQRKSFTKAAEELYLSQPTISTHIYQLEEELHTKLILRTTKSIAITPKGMELYNYATNILELKQRMLQACSVESKRIIHLGASTIPSAYILPQLLPEFGKLHADIYFVMHQSDSQGIIDADYYNNPDNEGHIMLPLINHGEKAVKIARGMRVAQGIFSRYLLVDGDKAGCGAGRGGGFGSTGDR